MVCVSKWCFPILLPGVFMLKILLRFIYSRLFNIIRCLPIWLLLIYIFINCRNPVANRNGLLRLICLISCLSNYHTVIMIITIMLLVKTLLVANLLRLWQVISLFNHIPKKIYDCRLETKMCLYLTVDVVSKLFSPFRALRSIWRVESTSCTRDTTPLRTGVSVDRPRAGGECSLCIRCACV